MNLDPKERMVMLRLADPDDSGCVGYASFVKVSHAHAHTHTYTHSCKYTKCWTCDPAQNCVPYVGVHRTCTNT